MKQPNILTDIVTGAKKRGYITQDEILDYFSSSGRTPHGIGSALR